MYNQDIKYLSRILKNGEGLRVEVKLSIDGIKDNVAKAICGIANQRGGKVIVGLAEQKYYKSEMGEYTEEDIIGDGYIVFGVKNSDRARLDLSSHLRANTNLGASIEKLYNVAELNVNNKKVLVFKVKPLFLESNLLATYKDTIYRRIDNQTVKLTAIDIVHLFSDRKIDSESLEKIDENMDAKTEEAVKAVVNAGKASTSMLQRRLRIGYGRSARLIDSLEEVGIISKREDSRPREVLINNVGIALERLREQRDL